MSLEKIRTILHNFEQIGKIFSNTIGFVNDKDSLSEISQVMAAFNELRTKFNVTALNNLPEVHLDAIVSTSNEVIRTLNSLKVKNENIDKTILKFDFVPIIERIKRTQQITPVTSNYKENLENYSKEFLKELDKIKNLQEIFQNQVNATISRFNEDAQNTLDKFSKTSIELTKNKEAEADESLSKLKLFVDDGTQIVHYLSGKALSGFFSERARDEQKSARYWTIGTWFFAIATLIALGIIFYLQTETITQNKELDLSALGTKILFTATLGLIAKWTSKRADRHMAEESKYHRLAVNMKTIDSFIEKLPEDKKNEILATVALKTFTEIAPNETATEFETASILDMAKGVLSKGEK